MAMQIAALKPQYVTDTEVPEDYKKHEMEILAAQIANDPKMAGKPEKVIQGAVMGPSEQGAERDLPDGSGIRKGRGRQAVRSQVRRGSGQGQQAQRFPSSPFVRYETGEGIEKKEEDFAAEVAKQMGM